MIITKSDRGRRQLLHIPAATLCYWIWEQTHWLSTQNNSG